MVTKIQAIIIIGSMFISIAACAFFVIFQMKRNNILIDISQMEDNVVLYSSIRVHVHENKFYQMNDILNKNPIKGILYDEVEDNIIKSEGLPIIGINRIVKVNKVIDLVELNLDTKKAKKDLPYKLVPYAIYTDDDSVQVNDDMRAWVYEARRDLYETTKTTLTPGEQMARIAIPIGIIILAAVCLIFFPKIYTTVMKTGNQAVQNSINTFEQTVRGFIPNG